MAKTKKNERGKVKLGLRDLSDETYKLIQRLDDVSTSCMDIGLTADELIEIGQALKDECGGDAMAWVHIDEYFGNSVGMKWWRPETDEEWTKRLEKNKNNALAARKARVAAKKQNELDEKAELKRLIAKFPEEE